MRLFNGGVQNDSKFAFIFHVIYKQTFWVQAINEENALKFETISGHFDCFSANCCKF